MAPGMMAGNMVTSSDYAPASEALGSFSKVWKLGIMN
jgi:hypothetical protein